MENKDLNRAIRVGIFLTLGLIILVVGILTLGSLQKSFVKNIHLESVFSDVSGLKKGNSIWFSGVKVGSISSIKFAGISKVVVQMNIEQSVQQYIHKDAGVKISSDGLIGNKIIEIGGGSPSAPIVENGDILAVITSVSTDQIMKNLETNNENLMNITADLKKVSSKMAQGKGLLGAVISDSTLASEFHSILKNLKLSSIQTLEISKNTHQFSSSLNDKKGLTHKLLTDTLVFNQLHLTVQKLNQITKGAETFLGDLNKAGEKLNSTKSPIGVLLNDETSAKELKSTLNQLHQSSIKLNDDLEAAQHNFLLKGFFKKRNKILGKNTDSLNQQP